MAKKHNPTNTTQKLIIDGKEEEFLFTISYKKDDRGRVIHDSFGRPVVERYLFRPKEEQLYKWPRLTVMRRASLSSILDDILAATETYNPSNKLFNDEFDKYIESVKKNGSRPVRKTSYANIEIIARKHIHPYFEGYLVREVDDTQCRNMINSLFNAGYSESIISKAHMYVNEFLHYLSFKDVIKKNWLDAVPMPTKEQIANKRKELGKKEKGRHYLTDEELKKIRYVIYNGYDAPQKSKAGKTYTVHKEFSQPEVFDFLLITGLRTGELLALRYSDWNKDEMTLNINKGRVTYIDRSGDTNKLITIETPPKNTASNAVLYLSTEANNLLIKMLSKEPEGYSGYIVHNKKHEPLSVRSFEGRFYRVIEAAGLQNVSPHDFRHTYASILKEKTNNDIHTISKKMRHKDATTTANIYIDLREDKEREFDKKVSILGEL